jgi:hypothetical protein
MNFIVVFNPTFDVWRINFSNPVWQVVRWTVWRAPIRRLYGYKTYIVVLYIMVAAVFLSVAGLAWLTLAMRKQDQSKWLRVAALGLHVVYDVLFVMCYVSFFGTSVALALSSVLLAAQYFGTHTGARTQRPHGTQDGLLLLGIDCCWDRRPSGTALVAHFCTWPG